MKALAIHDLAFSYRKGKPVLDGLDLELEEGSVTGILGRNGCGKSTLFDILIGHYRSFQGEILVGGDPLPALPFAEFSRRVAYVPQSYGVNMDFSVFEYISFGRNCHLRFGAGLSGHDRRLVYKYAEFCGITHLLGENINRLSGGEKQLACIARALTQESPLILMDEPASALDFGNQAKLLRMLQALQASGKTILFTTHNPGYILELGCDAAVMLNGKIDCRGRAEDVITADRLEKIYGEDVRTLSTLRIPGCG